MTRALRAGLALALALVACPARAEPFGSRGEIIVSADRLAQAIAAEHARSQDRTSDLVAIGESFAADPIERQPRLGVDVALFPHFTLGAAGSYGHGDANGGASAWLVAPRVGFAVPVGARLGIWPRAGIEHAFANGETRDHAVVEGEIALFLAGRGAITATPALELPLSERGGARFTFTAGLLARFGGEAPRADAPAFGKEGQILLSAERIAPLASYARQTRLPTRSAEERELALGPSHVFDRSTPSRAGLGLDVVVGGGFTFGGTLGLDLVPWESTHAPDPNATTAHGLKLGISPRVGFIARPSDTIALWLRAGVTYIAALARYDHVGTPRAHELDLVLEPVLVWFPEPGIGIMIGPSASTTAIASSGGPRAPLDDVGAHVVALSANGGLVLAF